MIGFRRERCAAIGAAIVILAVGGGAAQGASSLRLHTTLEGDARPYLCKDLDSTSLVVAVLGRALQARADGDSAKATRLFELGAKLESEICVRPPTEDIVILRCNLGTKTFGDTEISSVKVSALLRSNSSAGEQPFYAWTYATIEPGDGGTAAQEADKKWCTEEQVADAPLEPTPDVIQRVQQRFFDFGFRMPQIDGRLNQETLDGLIAFQKLSGLPQTGQITKVTLEKIDAMEAPTPWVALAFNGYGRFAIARAPTRRGAEADAVTTFRRKSSGEYKLVSAPYPNCIAVATTSYKSRRRTYTQTFSGGGESETAASDTVLEYCKREKGGGTCKVKDAMCAAEGQQPVRYEPKNEPVNTPAPRFDPGNISINASKNPQRFNPANFPANAPAPDNPNLQLEPENPPNNVPPQVEPGAQRFDPKNLPENAQAPGGSLGAESTSETDDSAPEDAGADKPAEQTPGPPQPPPNP